MTTRYQKRHYEDVAELLRNSRLAYEQHGARCPEHGDLVGCLMSEFVALFTADNPLFARARFLAACDLGYPDTDPPECEAEA